MHACHKKTDVFLIFCSVVTNTATYADKVIRVWNTLQTFIYNGHTGRSRVWFPDGVIGIFHWHNSSGYTV